MKKKKIETCDYSFIIYNLFASYTDLYTCANTVNSTSLNYFFTCDVIIFQDCNSPGNLTSTVTFQSECPAPLVIPEGDNPSYPVDGTACALPCPLLSYTLDEYKVFFFFF